MKSLDLPHLEWVGAADLQPLPDGAIKPWRLPRCLLEFLEQRSRFQAGNPAGVRLRFDTDAREIRVLVEPEEKVERWFDLLSDGQLVERVALPPGHAEVRFTGMSNGRKTIELWLTHTYAPMVVQSIQINDDATFWPAPPQDKKRLVFYGSSISHGRGAAGPTETWTVGAARLVGVDPINLGLGGACTLEPTVMQFLRDLPADYMSVCLGANVVLNCTHSPRSFRSAVIGLIRILREKHPRTPIAVQSTIYMNRPIESKPNAVEMSIEVSRQIVAECVECLQRQGDEQLHYTNGLELLGPEEAGLLYDNTHPDAQGHRLMSQRYAQKVWPALLRLDAHRHAPGPRAGS